MHEDILELIERAQAGSRTAIDELCQKYDRMIHRIARQVVRPRTVDHDDLVQEGRRVFVQCVHRFDVKYGCRLSQFAANQITQAMWTIARSGKRVTTQIPESLADTSRDPLQEVINRIDFLTVSRAMSVLSGEELEVLQRRVNGQSLSEIADAMGSTKIIAWRIADRAKRRVIESLQKAA